MNYELSSEQVLRLIRDDQEVYGVQRTLLLASMHGWFMDDAESERDPVACRIVVLIRRAHPNLINV